MNSNTTNSPVTSAYNGSQVSSAPASSQANQTQLPATQAASSTTSSTAQSGTVSSASSAAPNATSSMPGSVSMVVASFSTRPQAEKAVIELRQKGFTTEEINVVSRREQGSTDSAEGETEFYDDDITDGAMTGGALGGIGGLLIGAGALAIPGIGPIVAAGPIAAALSGVVAGGIAGGLIDYGIPAEASKEYEQKISKGEILAMVRASGTKVNQASSIFTQNGANEVNTHAIA